MEVCFTKIKAMPTPNPKNHIAAQIPQLLSLQREDTVDLEITAVDLNTGGTLINSCMANLKFGLLAASKADRLCDLVENNHVPIPGQPENRYATFLDMFLDALASAGGAVDQYITAVKIYYGMRYGRVRLLFEPVALKRTSGPDAARMAGYDMVFSGRFYIYNKDAKRFEITDDHANLVQNYQSGMKIKRDGVNYSDFVKDIDVEAVTFTFQEIFALLYENGDEATVSFYNATQSFAGVIKHTLLLAPALVTPPGFIKSLRGVYADLAHLCPPHCSSVRLKLE